MQPHSGECLPESDFPLGCEAPLQEAFPELTESGPGSWSQVTVSMCEADTAQRLGVWDGPWWFQLGLSILHPRVCLVGPGAVIVK